MTNPYLPKKRQRPDSLDVYSQDGDNLEMNRMSRADFQRMNSAIEPYQDYLPAHGPMIQRPDATAVARPRGHTGIGAMLAQLLDEGFGSGASRRREEFAQEGGPAGQYQTLVAKLRALKQRAF